MNLVVDVGNTRVKYAFFDSTRLVEAKYSAEELSQDIAKWKKEKGRIDIFLSGSGKLPEEIRSLLRETGERFVEASPVMELPLQIGYATPATLGFDRIAICVGARSLYPASPLLVIDSGTAITFNFVDAQGIFRGGNISPGLEMRFRGLHQFTARLPYVAPAEEYGGIGRTTEEAIRNGVMDGILFEVERYIERFMVENKDGRVVITGGNGHFLEKRLKLKAYFCKYLGFIGLNEILIYTKKYV